MSYFWIDDYDKTHDIPTFDVDKCPCVIICDNDIFVYAKYQEQMNQLIEQIISEYSSRIKTITNFECKEHSNIKCMLFSL